MKKTFIVLSFLLCVCITAMADDVKRLGFTGQVTSASTETEYFSFGPSGNLVSVTLDVGTGVLRSSDITATSTGFKCIGSYNRDDVYGSIDVTFDITVSGGHISKVAMKYDLGSLTATYTADANNRISKIASSDSWATVEVVTGYQTDYATRQRQAQKVIDDAYRACGRKPWDILGNQRRLEAAQRKAQQILEGTNIKAKTTKKSFGNKATMTFSGYSNDEHGNWKSRYVSENGNMAESETRTIVYDPDYLCSLMWEKLEKAGELKPIETFAMEAASKKYQAIASGYWNERILKYVEETKNNELESLLDVACSPIANHSVQNKAFAIVREQIYNEQVAPQRDFRVLRNLANMQRRGRDVFDESYKSKIINLSEKFRADSVAFLTNKANKEMGEADYTAASKTWRNIISIDPRNNSAANMLAESEFNILKNKERSGLTKENDYLNYQKEFTYSPLANQAGDLLADYAIGQKKAHEKCSFSEYLNQYMSVPMSAEANNKLAKAVTRATKRCNRGNFMGIVFGAFGGTGFASDLLFGGEAGLRFGYLTSRVNLYVGGKYQWDIGLKNSNDRTGSLEYQQISIPVVLRINFANQTGGGALYMGLGAEYIMPQKGKWTSDSDVKIKATKDVVGENCFAPRLSYGYTTRNMDMEFFISYNLKEKYNTTYLSNPGLGVVEAISQETYDSQTKSRVNFGMSVRFGF